MIYQVVSLSHSITNVELLGLKEIFNYNHNFIKIIK